MERRTRLEITAEILQIAVEGAKKTHIVYAANLNHALVDDYLEKLEDQGLISRSVKPRNGLMTTQKGLEFVQKYRDLQMLANS